MVCFSFVIFLVLIWFLDSAKRAHIRAKGELEVISGSPTTSSWKLYIPTTSNLFSQMSDTIFIKISGLIQDGWILVSVSTFNLLQYIIFISFYEKNMPHKVVGEGRGYFHSLFRLLWIFFFDTKPKLDKW